MRPMEIIQSHRHTFDVQGNWALRTQYLRTSWFVCCQYYRTPLWRGIMYHHRRPYRSRGSWGISRFSWNCSTPSNAIPIPLLVTMTTLQFFQCIRRRPTNHYSRSSISKSQLTKRYYKQYPSKRWICRSFGWPAIGRSNECVSNRLSWRN